MQTSESHGQEENDIDVSNGGSCKYKTETPRARVIEVHMAGFVVQLDSATLGSRAGSDQHASLLASSKSEYQDINSSFALYGCSLLTMLCRPILMFVVMFVVVLAAEDVTRDVRGHTPMNQKILPSCKPGGGKMQRRICRRSQPQSEAGGGGDFADRRTTVHTTTTTAATTAAMVPRRRQR